MAIPQAAAQQQVPSGSVQQGTLEEEQIGLDWLRKATQVGLEDVRHGRYVELSSPEEIKAHLAKLLP